MGLYGSAGQVNYAASKSGLVGFARSLTRELGGRGIGGHLVEAAIERATTEGLTIQPDCPFARGWLEKHPDAHAGVTVAF